MSPPHFVPGSRTTHLRRVMFFIDGGYLRRRLEDLVGSDDFDIKGLKDIVLRRFREQYIVGELIRIYYYDAICDVYDERYETQKLFFDNLNEKPSVEVKLGEIISSPKGDRQKGVDILIAIDMLTKAYEDHFDIAVFLCGDRDFMPLVKAVKNQAGKRVYGVFFENHCPEELINEFDRRFEIRQKDMTFVHKRAEPSQ